MTQLSIPRHPAGPNAVDRHRQPASTTQSGSGSAPVWTRRDAPMTDASDIGLRRAAPGTGGLAARPVSVPGSSLQPAPTAPAGPQKATNPTGTLVPNSEARPSAAADSPKDSLPLLAPLKLAVTLAAMWFKLLHRVSSDINHNVAALENDPRRRVPRR